MDSVIFLNIAYLHCNFSRLSLFQFGIKADLKMMTIILTSTL